MLTCSRVGDLQVEEMVPPLHWGRRRRMGKRALPLCHQHLQELRTHVSDVWELEALMSMVQEVVAHEMYELE